MYRGRCAASLQCIYSISGPGCLIRAVCVDQEWNCFIDKCEVNPFTAQHLAEIVLKESWVETYPLPNVESSREASNLKGSKSLTPGRLSLDLENSNSPAKSQQSSPTRPLRSYAVEFRIEYDALDIKERIGDGGYGSVFKAVWKTGHVFCAVKMLKQKGIGSASDGSIDGSDEEDSDMLLDPSPRDDFERETALLRELHHPNLVVCYGMCPGGPGVP